MQSDLLSGLPFESLLKLGGERLMNFLIDHPIAGMALELIFKYSDNFITMFFKNGMTFGLIAGLITGTSLLNS